MSRIKTSTRVGLLGLVLCAAVAGTAAPERAVHVSAAAAAPTITVQARLSTHYLNVPTPRFVAVRRLTLHVTGSSFDPGSKVALAIVDSSSWKLLARASTYAWGATESIPCSEQDLAFHCRGTNALAGTIDYRLHLDNSPHVSGLEVLYRSAAQTGIHEVALQ